MGRKKIKYIVGIDEVGRGPIAGPVTVGALKIPYNFNKKFFSGIRDSKKLSSTKREEWNKKIRGLQKNGKLDFSISSLSSGKIDEKGISWCLSTAIKRCLKKLRVNPSQTQVLLDGGIKAPKKFLMQKTIIKGDDKIPVISGASILAKVYRDKRMVDLSKKHLGYGFEIHKGYGTRYHYKMLENKGFSPIHRKSFLEKVDNKD